MKKENFAHLQDLQGVRIAEQMVQKQPYELTVEAQQVERHPAEEHLLLHSE